MEEAEVFVGAQSAENVYLEKESYNDLTKNIALELSEFEYKVLSSFLAGEAYADIACNYNVSVKSVDNALKRIRTKLSSRKK